MGCGVCVGGFSNVTFPAIYHPQRAAGAPPLTTHNGAQRHHNPPLTTPLRAFQPPGPRLSWKVAFPAVVPPRPTPPPEPSVLSYEDIVARELAAKRRRHLRWWLLGIILAALALTAGFGGRPALHAVKAWQARRLAMDARRLMDQGKWLDARKNVGDALMLWPQEPDAVRVTAQFLGRVGNYPQALVFWKRLENLHALAPADQTDFANAELATGNLDPAEARLRLAWPDGTPGTLADWKVGMQLAARRGHAADAAALARRILADRAAEPRTRLAAAAALLTSDTGAEAQTLGWQAVVAIAADGKSVESLDALTALARRVATTPPAANAALSLPPLSELIARIETHPLAKISQQLFALDLRAAQEPARRNELIQSAVQRYASTRDDAELGTLAAWLYGKGEVDKVLDVLPPERAAGDRALFLQRLDALGAENRWTDIRETIRGGKFPLEPTLAQMYLARCATQLGEPKVAAVAWEGALQAAGKEASKLVSVGQYAAKNGVLDIADKAFRQALAVAPDSREVNEGFFQLLDATGKTRELRDALAAFSAHFPQDRSLQNDLAYFDALLGVDVPAARLSAQQLVRAEPGSLPHRVTLALAELRLGNGLAALDAFRGLTLPSPSTMPSRQQAVYAATLWKTSYEHDARDLTRIIVPDRLLPEERELIRPILENAPPSS